MDTNAVNGLNAQLVTAIPLINAMNLRVLSASPDSVLVALPFEGNGNDKGTLFVGASYSPIIAPIINRSSQSSRLPKNSSALIISSLSASPSKMTKQERCILNATYSDLEALSKTFFVTPNKQHRQRIKLEAISPPIQSTKRTPRPQPV